jgi:predicted RNase H-like HicB family nuclease
VKSADKEACDKFQSKRLVLRRFLGDNPTMEVVFTVAQESDGGYVAECLSHDIFTQGSTWEELRANVREAVSAYFFDQPKPAAVRLHLVRDELLASA